MIVTVIAVGVVQMSRREGVNMISMWHGFMAATSTVSMCGIVCATVVVRHAIFGIGGGHRDHVLVVVFTVHVVQVAVVKVVCMPIVLNWGMAAAVAVKVAVFFVFGAGHVDFLVEIVEGKVLASGGAASS